jgi:hypothetical protein
VSVSETEKAVAYHTFDERVRGASATILAEKSAVLSSMS